MDIARSQERGLLDDGVHVRVRAPGDDNQAVRAGVWRKADIHKQAESLFSGIQLWAQRYQRNGGLPQEASFDDNGDVVGSQEAPTARPIVERPATQPPSARRGRL